VFGDLEGAEVLSSTVAIIRPDGDPAAADGQGPASGVGLIESTMPLRTENTRGPDAPVDLDLERSEGDLRAQNPLVPVVIPSEIGEGITLPEQQVSIELPGAPEGRTPSTIDGSTAFYPNVAEETDLAVVPTATGVETFTQLRSSDAPRSQTFELFLPSGASLAAAEGGAEVRRGDELLLSVREPFAFDAAGEEVPVELEVSGSTLTLRASPAADALYPILVDPVFETYDWPKYYGSLYPVPAAETPPPGWYPANTSPSIYSLYNRIPWANASEQRWGLNIFSGGGPVQPGTQANWNYYVPRFFSDYQKFGERPTSFIRHVTAQQLEYRLSFGDPKHNSPYFQGGIWNSIQGGWISVATRVGSEGELKDPAYKYEFDNPNSNKMAKNFGVALLSTESWPTNERRLTVGMATVELADGDLPDLLFDSPASQWVNQTPTAKIPYTASDTGLGVKKVGVEQVALGGARSIVTGSHSCTGGVSSPCPAVMSNTTTGAPALPYNPATMPQGDNWVWAYSYDALGNRSANLNYQARIRVDHTKPTLSLSGTLTEQEKLGPGLASYNLKYQAADGDSAAPAAQTPFGTAGTGIGQLQRPMGVALDAAGNSYVVDRECKCVQKYDPAGTFLTQFNAAGLSSTSPKFTDPRGIAVTSSGDIWVADLGNKRVYQLSPTGSLVRTLEYGYFSEPYAVAAVAGGGVWVSDIGTHKVYKFGTAGSTPTVVVYGSKSRPTQQNALDLVSPVGLTVDETGAVWVMDNNLNRVTAYSPSGQWVTQFGSGGTATGQFTNPVGIEVAPTTGNVLVADGGNNRVQEFRPDGEFLRQFGTLGAAGNQLSEPRGIALAPDRTLYIADAGNKRIAKWSHASFDPQAGVASTEIKVDGQLVEPKHAPGCATKDCTVSREWTLDANKFSSGQHMLEVTATDGAGLATMESMTFQTRADLAPPTVALSGSMTQQEALGTTRPSYTLKVNATDPGGAEESKSGVAATSVKVDGVTVDSASPGCPAGGCSITREWTLNSNSYSVGNHTVLVTATDAAGWVATKSLTITINRDTTAPEVNTAGFFNSLFNRPEGWVEQKTYNYFPQAKDPNGYGVTSLVFKFDGTTIANKAQTCPQGACEANVIGSLNMAAYDGGAHAAEVVATDGAGNTRKRNWTINVDPAGQISVAEAEDTLEALDETSAVNTMGPSKEEEEFEGTAPGLGLKEANGEIEATGTKVPTTIELEADGEVTMQVLDPERLGDCEVAEEGAEASCIAEPSSEKDEDAYAGLDPVVVTPVGTAPSATENDVAGGTVAVAANTSSHVDSIIRPLYDGTMIFQAIRDAAAPETFSWEVKMTPEQELVQINDRYAVVRYDDGVHVAYGIDARPAHDAIGSTVPTKLSVSNGNVVTLTVQHRSPSPAGGSFVYPVIGGTGWQGGFMTHYVDMPPPEIDPESQIGMELTFDGYEIFSAPEPVFSGEGEAWASTITARSKNFIKVVCSHYRAFDEETLMLSNYEYKCGNPWTGDTGIAVAYRAAMRGKYFYDGNWVWHRGNATNGIGCHAFALNPPNATEDGYFRQRRAWVDRCVWWGSSPGGNGGQKQDRGHHITAFGKFVGESRGNCGDDCGGTPNPWESFPIPKEGGMAYYLWPNGNKEYHATDCIDCD
jgi:YD repeat-containing protein